MLFQRIYLLLVLVFSCTFLYACACASTDSCAEEWYGGTDRDSMDRKNAKCFDQEKYDSCVERCIAPPSGYSISEYCKEQAVYRCSDRKIYSSK